MAVLKWLALHGRQSGYLVSVYFEYAWHCHGNPALAQNDDLHHFPDDLGGKDHDFCDDRDEEDGFEK